jgi:RNA polymerase sigma-70 factor (ECF subfamily)
VLQEYAPALSRLARSYAPDDVDQQDLLQDIAFALWKALPSFRNDCSERTFVYRVAHNRGLSHRFRQPTRTLPLEAAAEVMDHGTAPDDAAQRNDRSMQLREAVGQLPDGMRQAVVLRLEGLPDREIADVMGISVNNVAVRLTRARALLRRLLGEEAP